MPGSIDLVIVGQVVGGKIVVGVFSGIEGVSTGIERIAAIFPGIGRAGVSCELRIRDPGSRFAAARDPSLDRPMVAQLGRRVDPILGIAVIRIGDGVAVGVVVGGQLRFKDVYKRQRLGRFVVLPFL